MIFGQREAIIILNLFMMIITDNYCHHEEANYYINRKPKVIFEAQKETKKYFEDLLSKSIQPIHKDYHAQMQTLRKDREDKVYANLEHSSNDFLLILLRERNKKIEKQASLVKQVLHKREKGVMNDLKAKSLQIDKSSKSILQIKKQLEQDILIMKAKNPERHFSSQYYESIQKKQQLKYQSLQFRKQSYWKVPNQKHQSALQQIIKIRKQQQKIKQRYQDSMSMSQRKRIKQQQQQQFIKQQRKIQEKRKLHQSYNQYKQEREFQIKELTEKQRRAEQFLQKFRHQVPAFILLQQRGKKMLQLEDKRSKHILQSAKLKKKGYSLSQIMQDYRHYQENKQKHAQELQQKRLLDLQSEQQIKSRLRLLYKAKIRSLSANQQSMTPDKDKKKQQKMIKMLMYSQKVKEKYRPNIDFKKRDQIMRSIEDSIKVKNKFQKKQNGQVLLLDKQDFHPREFGLRYLEQIKKQNKAIERMPIKSPPPEQKVDRSISKKPQTKKPITPSNWKQIIENETLSQEQKQCRIQGYFKLVQRQKIKSIQDRNKSSISKSLQIQQKIDHYQLEKAAAKLALLKSMMLQKQK